MHKRLLNQAKTKHKSFLAWTKNRANSFHKLSRRKKAIISIILLVSILAPTIAILLPKKTEASWFDTDWLYRKEISISGNTSDLTDYQIKLEDVDLTSFGSKLQSDCDDIRFTNLQGALLDYWIETPPNLAGTNIALSSNGATATARSSYDPYGGIGPSGAIDGNESTHWTSDGYYDGWYRGGEWLQVDFGSEKTFDTIQWVNNHGSNSIATEYNIEISSNGSDWTEIVHEYSNSDSSKIHSFTAKTARYVRMTGLQIVAYPTFALSEFRVFEQQSGSNAYCSSNPSSDIWVKVPKLYSSGTKIYMYYGNTNASQYSNGSKTFQLFDNFESETIHYGLWDTTDTRPATSTGAGTLTFSNNSEREGILSKNSFSINSKIIFRASQSTTNLDQGIVGFSNSTLSSNYNADDSTSYVFDSTAGGNFERESTNGGTSSTSSGSTTEDNNNLHDFEIGWRTGGTDFTIDNSSDGSITSNVPNSASKVRAEIENSSESLTLYWIAVAKYDANPPDTISFGDEEISPALGDYILYYPFYEGSGLNVTDVTPSGNNGTLLNASWSNDGKFDHSISFNGVNSNVASDNNLLQTLKTEGSISMWVKPAALTNASHAEFFMLPGLGGGANSNIRMGHYSDGDARFEYEGATNNHQYVNVDSVLSVGTWTHLEAVWTAGQPLKLYVNTTEYTGSTLSNTNHSGNDAPLYIGGWGGSEANGWFNGIIDEVKVYDYARSATEVENDYNAGAYIAGLAQNQNEEKSHILAPDDDAGNSLLDGLAAWWRLDEGSGTLVEDTTVNNNDGTAYGPTIVTDGKYGNALDFESSESDYVSIPNSDSVNLNLNFSITAWIKPESFPSIAGVVTKLSNSSDKQYALSTKGSSIGFDYENNGNNWEMTGGTLSSGTWQLVTVTITSSRYVTLYINTTAVNSGTPGSTTDLTTQAVQIGRWGGGYNSNYFDGVIDDVRIYNRVLETYEIEALYNGSGVVSGNWRLDEKSGQTAYDSGLLDNDATLSGSMTDVNWVYGKLNNSLNFDGSDDYVTAGNNSIFNASTGDAFTITTWFKTDSAVSSNELLIGNGGLGGTIGYAMYLNSSGQVVCGIDDDTSSFPEDSVTSTLDYDDQNWHWAVCAKNGGTTLKLYVDGQLEGTDATISATGTLGNSEDFVFGGNNGSYSFGGQLDEVVHYKYIASDAEIQRVYESFSSPQYPNNNGLVGYWKMDEDSWNGTSGEVIDSSGFGYNGRAMNGANTVTNGKKHRAGNFNDSNNQYVLTSDISQIDLSGNALTISAWVYPVSTGAIKTVVAKYDWDNGEREFVFYVGGTNDVGLNIQENPGSYNGATGITSGTKVLSNNTWYHIAGVFEGGSFSKVFIDGKLVGVNNSSPANDFGNTNEPVILGAANDNAIQDPFDGKMDEIKIWNRALTDDEITADYNSFNDVLGGTEKRASTPIAHYEFEKKSGTAVYDSIGNDNNGTMVNMTGADNSTQGKVGNAYHFNGSDEYINIPNNIDLTNNLSISAWINPDEIKTGAERQTIISLKEDQAGAILALPEDNQDNLRLWLYLGTWRYCDSSTTIPASEWTQAGATYDGSNMKIYIDGRLDNTCSWPGTVSDSSSNSAIGRRNSDSVNFFHGKLDNIKVWNNSTIDARGMAIEYNDGAPIGWWKMDQGEGNTTYDYSGKGNHGTFTNMSTSTAWILENNCILSKCIQFDGDNDYILINNAVYEEEGTLSLWFKANDYGFIVGSYNSGDNRSPSFSIDGTSHTLIWEFGDLILKDTGKSVDLNTWYHAAMTYDSNNNIRVYLNGELVGQDTATVSVNFNSQFALGRYLGFGSSFFEGTMDEAKIFNYAMTQDDIKIEYNKGAALRYE